MAINVTPFVGTDNFNMETFNNMISQINNGVNGEISDVLAQLGTKARVQTGSYVGTGTYGASNPCSLTFDFTPRLFCIYYEEIAFYTNSAMDTILKYIGGSVNAIFPNNLSTSEWGGFYSDYTTYPSNATFYINFSGDTVSWYNTSSSTTSGENGTSQYNRKDAIYHWYAVG